MIDPITDFKEIDPSEVTVDDTVESPESIETPETPEETPLDTNTQTPGAGDEETPIIQAQDNGQQQPEEDEFWSPEDVSDLTSQITNGEFTSPEELYAKYSELKASADPLSKVSDFIKGLIQYEKAGGNPKDYVEVQSHDYSKMEAEEILRQKFIKDNPSLDRKKADILFRDEFKRAYAVINDENSSEEEKEVARIRLEVATNNAKGDLTKFQQDNSVFKAKEEDAQLKQEQDAYINEHLETVKHRVSNFQGIQVPVSDSEADDFKYMATPEVKQKVSEWMTDPHGSFLSEIAEDDQGNIDYEKFESKLAILADLEGYTSMIYNHGLSKGQEKLIAQRKNQTQPGITPTGSASNVASESDQLMSGFLNV
jgi:hypothetical protein